MKVRVFRDAAQASTGVARIVVRQLEAKPQSVLGLPTGRTAVPVFDEVVRIHAGGGVDFSRARTFNLDEFVGVASSDEGSFCAFMNRHLFTRVNIASRNVHFLNGAAKNLDAECRRFERAIAAAGGIDLLLLGIGSNGHVGFNEPGAALVARTHRARLMPSTRRANAALFGGRIDRVPREGLSMGMAAILGARAIVLIATGRAKRRAVRAMLYGPVTTSIPASFLQLHRNVEVILDRAAASARKVSSLKSQV